MEADTECGERGGGSQCASGFGSIRREALAPCEEKQRRKQRRSMRGEAQASRGEAQAQSPCPTAVPVSYTHLRAHETEADL
eukprot:979811-Rhodomonas_salina.1